MRYLLTLMLICGFGLAARGDIHAPPGADHGPTRKLGRGISNILYGASELPYTMIAENRSKGNHAAWGYGIVKGTGRVLQRLRYGVQEVVTFPFPTQKGKYTPPYRSRIIWKHRGYHEFPPELGNQNRFHHVRTESDDQ